MARRVFPMTKVRPAACKSPISVWYYNTVRYVNTSLAVGLHPVEKSAASQRRPAIRAISLHAHDGIGGDVEKTTALSV